MDKLLCYLSSTASYCPLTHSFISNIVFMQSFKFFLAMNTELNSLSGHVEILNVIKLDFLKSKLLLKLRHLTRFWTWPRFQYELNPVFGKSKPRALITSDRVSRRKNYKEKYIGGGSQKVKFRGKSLWVDALFNTARV